MILSTYAAEYAARFGRDLDEMLEFVDGIYELAREYGVENMDTVIPEVLREPLERLWPLYAEDER